MTNEGKKIDIDTIASTEIDGWRVDVTQRDMMFQNSPKFKEVELVKVCEFEDFPSSLRDGNIIKNLLVSKDMNVEIYLKNDGKDDRCSIYLNKKANRALLTPGRARRALEDLVSTIFKGLVPYVIDVNGIITRG